MDRKELDTRLNKMWKQIFNDLKKMKYDENPLELRSYDGAEGFLFEAKASPLLGLNRIMITMTPVAGAPFADGVVGLEPKWESLAHGGVKGTGIVKIALTSNRPGFSTYDPEALNELHKSLTGKPSPKYGALNESNMRKYVNAL